MQLLVALIDLRQMLDVRHAQWRARAIDGVDHLAFVIELLVVFRQQDWKLLQLGGGSP